MNHPAAGRINGDDRTDRAAGASRPLLRSSAQRLPAARVAAAVNEVRLPGKTDGTRGERRLISIRVPVVPRQVEFGPCSKIFDRGRPGKIVINEAGRRVGKTSGSRRFRSCTGRSPEVDAAALAPALAKGAVVVPEKK
jgi:hypothetical protein